MGEALDALTADWGDDIQETAVLIQRFEPDPYFTAAQQSRLQELLASRASLTPQERAERLKVRMLEHPQFLASGMAVFDAMKHALLDALADDDGPLRERATAELVGFADRLAADEALQARLDTWAADAAVFAVRRYGGELTAVITHTVERWDGKEAAQRIELHVGRDLQFIRINGTIVGGLVGVLIHTISVVLH